MNIESIATAAVALLAPYLAKAGEAFAKKAGEQLSGKVGDLYRAIKKKFKGDGYAEQTLTRAEEKPESEGRQSALKEVLVEKMGGDADFADRVCRLVEETREASGGDVITQHLDVSGKAGDVFQVGKMDGGITRIEGNVADSRSSSRVDKGSN